MRWFQRNKEKPSRKFTRIFFATDIHGSEPCFMKFINAASFYQADVIVLGGDITGKQIVAIECRQGLWTAHLFGQGWTAKNEDELAELQAKIRSNGYYPVVVSPDELAELEVDPGKVEILFKKVMTETVSRWIGIAEERLGGQPVRCYISPGNDDHFDLDAILSGSDVVLFPEGMRVDLDGVHSMASCGYANMTPWHCPRDITEDELSARLEASLQGATDLSHCIFNFHAPPYDSTLDIAPELDAEMRPVLVGGQPHQIPVGSRAVREVIEKYQPIAGLHGHIHECRGAVEIGRTLCLNPGSEYSEGILRGALVNLANGKLLSYQFVAG
ncbi:MAG: metallophosphoesterase [Chloroflexota bacterium]|nr:MAG: metallophosphoesterase [Chloroflexota bacterium]